MLSESDAAISLQETSPMKQEMSVLGIDIAKRLFHAVGMDERWIRSLKRFCRRPVGAVHCTAERGTARRELVQGAAGVAWGGREERWTRECNTPQGRDTCAARTVPPRPPSPCGLRRT